MLLELSKDTSHVPFQLSLPAQTKLVLGYDEVQDVRTVVPQDNLDRNSRGVRMDKYEEEPETIHKLRYAVMKTKHE